MMLTIWIIDLAVMQSCSYQTAINLKSQYKVVLLLYTGLTLAIMHLYLPVNWKLSPN